MFHERLCFYELFQSLVRFYAISAVPYWQMNGKPVPHYKEKALVPSALNDCKMLLPSDLPQSRIDGHNGSSACPVICTIFLQIFLLQSAHVDDDNLWMMTTCG